jgi:hypothetical protein
MAKHFRSMVAVGLISFLNLQALAQQNQSSSLPQKFLADASNVIQGTGYVLSAPLRWDGKDWKIFGSVIAGTFALSFLDEEVNDFFLRNRSETADKLTDIGTEYGEPTTVVLLTGSLYAIGLLADNDWLRESCVMLSASLLPTGGIQSATKMISGRARPHVGIGHDQFDPFRREEAYYSFFSGHTMVAMATSHVFAKRIHHPAAKVALYGLGTLGGLSRMYNQDHWLSDVILGNALAVASVNSVSKWLEAEKADARVGGLQWRITPYPRGVQLSFSW